MERQDFIDSVHELYDFFRIITKPPITALDAWYSKVSFIPIKALPWIVNRLEEEKELPRNIVIEFKRLWFAYLRSHPQLRAGTGSHCRECDGTGILLFRKLDIEYDPPQLISHVVACGKCNNVERVFGSNILDGGVTQSGIRIEPILRMTIDELEAAGYIPMAHQGGGPPEEAA